jgi:hypothetical protein
VALAAGTFIDKDVESSQPVCEVTSWLARVIGLLVFFLICCACCGGCAGLCWWVCIKRPRDRRMPVHPHRFDLHQGVALTSTSAPPIAVAVPTQIPVATAVSVTAAPHEQPAVDATVPTGRPVGPQVLSASRAPEHREVPAVPVVTATCVA